MISIERLSIVISRATRAGSINEFAMLLSTRGDVVSPQCVRDWLAGKCRPQADREDRVVKLAEKAELGGRAWLHGE
jgi:hypothetical protein